MVWMRITYPFYTAIQTSSLKTCKLIIYNRARLRNSADVLTNVKLIQLQKVFGPTQESNPRIYAACALRAGLRSHGWAVSTRDY